MASTRSRSGRKMLLAAMMATMSGVLVACGGAPAGKVQIDGSSTVFPISEAVAEEFSKVSEVRSNVGFSGTGGGFDKFCRGEIDIADASRRSEERRVGQE